MSEWIVFVGTYEIPEGGRAAFEAQAASMTRLVQEKEPRVVFIGHYVNEDATEGTSIHLHPDAESFDYHMKVAAAAVEAGARTVRVKRIEFYGQPSEAIVDQLSERFELQVKRWAGGYFRFEAP